MCVSTPMCFNIIFTMLTPIKVVKMFTVLVSKISNSQVFLLKNVSTSFANAKASHIFSAKILGYMPYLTIKVLTIRSLKISLVLNNWTLHLSEVQGDIYGLYTST